LAAGKHHFEVRARDRDFNIDPTPATLDFVVLPPVWRQEWFILLMALSVGLIAAQTARVFLEQGRLRRSNRALAAEVDERVRAEEALRTLNLELDQRVKTRTKEIEAANKELESFSYSVSHDLRAPLRSIDGFSRALLEDYSDKLDEEGKEDLQTIRAASQRMGKMIDDMLTLSRVTRHELRRARVDLSALAEAVAQELKESEPERKVEFIIAPGLSAETDPNLIRNVLENLIGNAWKFTGKEPLARIEFGQSAQNGAMAFFVRDNGVGFDMAYAQKLFGAFQRLHTVAEFPGTGVGLATVQRIINRQGGRVWAESAPDRGATFYFTLPQ
ncbi:MAG TPA: ATP-binding protein, partial [Candidatus Paceibacterota bacterium]|nr:ATP-binding protein [Candidatus Paceibacterota bacterium]